MLLACNRIDVLIFFSSLNLILSSNVLIGWKKSILLKRLPCLFQMSICLGHNYYDWTVTYMYDVLNLLQEGKALKMLATAARLDVEDFLQKKVYLEVPIYMTFILCLCYIWTWTLYFSVSFINLEVQMVFWYNKHVYFWSWKYLFNTIVWTLNRLK